MTKLYKRTPRNYEGVKVTNKSLTERLPEILAKIERTHLKSSKSVLESWGGIIGENFAPMTKAVSLDNGILLIKVKSSSLLNVLCQYEKGKLLEKVQEKFSKDIVRDIVFKFGQ